MDLILLFSTFRVHGYYPNIVKALAKEFSLGIVPMNSGSENAQRNTQKIIRSNEMQLEVCRALGARVIKPGQRVACRLLLMPQHDYVDSELQAIKADWRVILQRFGSGEAKIQQLQDSGAKEMWVYEERMFRDTVCFEGSEKLLGNMKIVEMGTPYRQHPAFNFDNLGIDYLVAYPTPMLTRDPVIRNRIFENLLKLIASIPESDSIVLKSHNSRDNVKTKQSENTSVGRGPLKEFFAMFGVPIVDMIGGHGVIPKRVHRLRGSWLERRVSRRCVSLESLTPYASFGIENFLPFVRKGIITGISSCIWHALYEKVPVFNCDDRPLNTEMPNEHIYKHFYVDSCHGNLSFDSTSFKRIRDETRQANIVDLIRSVL